MSYYNFKLELNLTPLELNFTSFVESTTLNIECSNKPAYFYLYIYLFIYLFNFLPLVSSICKDGFYF